VAGKFERSCAHRRGDPSLTAQSGGHEVLRKAKVEIGDSN